MSKKYIVWTIFSVTLPIINVGIIAIGLITPAVGVIIAGILSIGLVIWNDVIRMVNQQV